MDLLGEILLRRNLLNAGQLANALKLQTRSGSRLGDILISEGIIGYFPLYTAIAEHHGLPFVDLLKQARDISLLHESDIDHYLRLRAVPWKREGGTIWFATCEPTAELKAWIGKRINGAYQLAITSPVDIRCSIERAFSKQMETQSRLALWQRDPAASARVTMPPRQLQVMYGLLLLITTIIAMAPVRTALFIIMLCNAAFACTMIFKCIIFNKGTKRNASPVIDWTMALAQMDTRSLPIYTVLIPMYKETESLPHLLDAMQKLDYPPCKLDIKLVLEADDHETLQAAYALKPRYQFDIVRVPPSAPRTKPKACNYALRYARGEFVTVFDVDDRPERLQLKKAVYMFRTLPKKIVCLQARLNYYNANDNLLTRFFSLEYRILSHYMLAGLQRFRIPIPLGGTSNHIATARLIALGEWDPYNVTEDADLGTRLAAKGYRTAMLDSFTMEEAPNRIVPWIRQRSRWIKGYMQTWLVHMRNPAALYKSLGFEAFIGFQFFIGLSSFTFLAAPLVWILSLFWLGGIVKLHHVVFPDWLVVVTLTNLLLNLLTHWYLALVCAANYRRFKVAMTVAALLYPVYLLLHSIASYKALWQLIVKPHFWEKTQHGQAKSHARLINNDDILKTRGKPLTA